MKLVLRYKIIAAFLIFAVGVIATVSVIFTLNKEQKTISKQSYILLTGFKPSTQIEILIDNEKSKSLIISQKSEEKIKDFKFKNFIQYNINENNNFVDLSIIKDENTNILIAKLSGLEKGDAVNFSNNNQDNLIPVDWSGKIELSQSINQNPICFNIKTNAVKTICHFWGSGGAS